MHRSGVNNYSHRSNLAGSLDLRAPLPSHAYTTVPRHDARKTQNQSFGEAIVLAATVVETNARHNQVSKRPVMHNPGHVVRKDRCMCEIG